MGRRSEGGLGPMFARALALTHISTLVTEGAYIGFCTPQQGGFIVTFYNIVFAVPAAVFGHE